MTRLYTIVTLLFCLAFACKGNPTVGSQPVHNPEITVERLDRAVDFILSQDPPFITHGSLCGDCPFWSGGDPNVFVLCAGFWTYGVNRNGSGRCSDISIWKGDEMVPTGRMLDVSWEDGENISFSGWGVGGWTEDEKTHAEETLLAVLKACDHPPDKASEPEFQATGNQFSDFLARKTVRLGKSLGHSFGTTNECGGAWAVPSAIPMGDDSFSIPFTMRIFTPVLEATALDGRTNAIASIRACVMLSAFDAEFELFLALGHQYEWGSFHTGNVSDNVDFERENGILFALPNGKSNLAADDACHVYAVQSNVLVEVWTERDRKAFATALLDAGWKAAAGELPKSTAVEYGDKRMPDRYSPPEKSKRTSP